MIDHESHGADKPARRPSLPEVNPMDSILECNRRGEILDYHDLVQGLAGTLATDLPQIARSERTATNGNLARAILCELLVKIVPQGTRVRDTVSYRELRALWKKARKRVEKARGEAVPPADAPGGPPTV